MHTSSKPATGVKRKAVWARRAAAREVAADLQYTLARSITITVNGSYNTITVGPLTQAAVTASAPAPDISRGAAPAAVGCIASPQSSSAATSGMLARSITITDNYNTVTVGQLTQTVAASAPAPDISRGAAPAAVGCIASPQSSSAVTSGARATGGKRAYSRFALDARDVDDDHDGLAGANNDGAGGGGIRPGAGSVGSGGAAGGAVAAAEAALLRLGSAN
jgi:hypothetical protein